MCGFIFRKSSNLIGQTGYLVHRGPDEQSYSVFGNMEIEFSRLTITGELEGRVPVSSENQEWLVAFNGEIYNFQTLIARHALPATDSDTKVIAHGLQKYGIDFLRELRGMYAGVILNQRTKEIHLFRDPLGEKPLFYHRSKDQLIAASEFTTILRILKRSLKLSVKAVSDYFRFGYAGEPLSFDEEIFSVTRGAVVRLRDDYSFEHVLDLHGYDEIEVNAELPDLLSEINKEVTFSNVATGLALSAGVDSSSLLYALTKFRKSDFVPLIVNIAKDKLSLESIQAVESCKRLGIKPHIVNSFGSPRIVDYLKVLAFANDQPHADPSGLSYLSIFQEAKNLDLKIVLLGHGPDEIFWGYPWYNNLLERTNHSKNPIRLNSRTYWNTPAKSQRLLWLLEHEDENTKRFTTDAYLNSSDSWERFRAEIVHSYLSSNGLRQSDRLAMANGIEPRTPYADARLYGWAQVNSTKNNTSFDKSEFRAAIELGELNEVRYRKKEGFQSPLADWFKNHAFKDLTGDCLVEVLKQDLSWRFKPHLRLLSASDSYRIIMLGMWLARIKEL